MNAWDDIRLVSLVVRHGSLTAAARALDVAHTTLSRRIAAVEKRQGVRLFDRLPEGFVPTSAGRQMADAGDRIEGEVAALELSLLGKDTELAGPLRITAPLMLVQSYLGNVLRDFVRINPRIELHINAAHQALDLSRREADVAVRATNNPPENLFGRRVAVQKRAPYAALSYLEGRQGNGLDSGHDWLGFDWWDAETANRLDGRVIARFDDTSALVGALRAGLGVARIPCFVGDSDPTLRRLPGSQPEPYLDFWVLCHPSLKEVGRVRAFMRFVAARFKEDAGLFSGENPET